MKNVISYLKALWSRVAGSQRNDVEFDRRLTVGSPSGFTINWTLMRGERKLPILLLLNHGGHLLQTGHQEKMAMLSHLDKVSR